MIAFNNGSHPFLRRIRLRFAITSPHLLPKFIYVRREHYSPQSVLVLLRIQKPMQVQFSGSASTPEGHISQCLPDQNYLWPSMETSEMWSFHLWNRGKILFRYHLNTAGADDPETKPLLGTALLEIAVDSASTHCSQWRCKYFLPWIWWTYRQLWYVLRSWRVGWKSSLGEEEDWLNILQWWFRWISRCWHISRRGCLRHKNSPMNANFNSTTPRISTETAF